MKFNLKIDHDPQTRFTILAPPDGAGVATATVRHTQTSGSSVDAAGFASRFHFANISKLGAAEGGADTELVELEADEDESLDEVDVEVVVVGSAEVVVVDKVGGSDEVVDVEGSDNGADVVAELGADDGGSLDAVEGALDDGGSVELEVAVLADTELTGTDAGSELGIEEGGSLDAVAETLEGALVIGGSALLVGAEEGGSLGAEDGILLGGSDEIELDDVKGGSLVVDGGLLGGAEGPELGALEGGSLTEVEGTLEVELMLLERSGLAEVDDTVDAGGSLLDVLDVAADTDGALEAGGSTLTGAVGSDDALDGGIGAPEDGGITSPKVDPGGSRLLDDELDEEVKRPANKMSPVVVLVVRVEGSEVDVPVAGGSTEVVGGLLVGFDVLVVFGLLEVVDVFVVFVEEVCFVELEVVILAFKVSGAWVVFLVVFAVVFGFLLVLDFLVALVLCVVAAFARRTVVVV